MAAYFIIFEVDASSEKNNDIFLRLSYQIVTSKKEARALFNPKAYTSFLKF